MSAASNPVIRKSQVPAAIERYFQTCLFLLVATGFVTLATTGKLDMTSVALVSCAIIFRAYQIWKRDPRQIPERLTSYLGLIYVLVFAADLFLISGNFVNATVHLVLFVMVTKLFSVQRDRDLVYLAVLAFLEVLSAAILTVDSVFIASFSAWLLVGIATFVSMEMRRSSLAASNLQRGSLDPQAGTRRFTLRRLNPALSMTSAVLVMAILVGAVVLFFFMPRLSGGYLSRFAQENDIVSGFSDNVQLGEIGGIQRSSQVIAHVRIEDGGSGYNDLKLRGTTLSYFNGRAWSTPVHETEFLRHGGRWGFDLANIKRLSPELTHFAVPDHHVVINYRVMMEPIGTNGIVFIVPAGRYLYSTFREITVDSSGTVVNTDPNRPTGVYSGTSDIGVPSPDSLRGASAEVPDAIARKYLNLPALDPRVRKLAHDLMAKEPDPYDKAVNVEQYLQNKFTYTLELPSEHHDDPLAHFLLERKAGHCEYFASAMAVLLRIEGIPTRIVTGFRGGEFNDITGDYIIRARHAHSWVEAYFPGRGWVAFDPTPASGNGATGEWGRLALYVDAMREFWREWVINYDSGHQRTLSIIAQNRGREMFDRFRIWARDKYEALLEQARTAQRKASDSPKRVLLTILLVIGGVVILVNLPRIYRAARRGRIARNPAKSPSHAASIWYARLTRRLSKRGFTRKPSHTPSEFASSIGDSEVREAVTRFNNHYERARFGESSEDAEKLPEIYKEVVEKS